MQGQIPKIFWVRFFPLRFLGVVGTITRAPFSRPCFVTLAPSSSSITAGHGLCVNFSLWLSRACLGKMTIFRTKWLERGRFPYLPCSWLQVSWLQDRAPTHTQ